MKGEDEGEEWLRKVKDPQHLVEVNKKAVLNCL